MDVRVKVAGTTAPGPERQEILTGLSDSSLESIMRVLAAKHPDLRALFQPAKESKQFEVFVNNTQIPGALRQGYHVRDGDTVSLLLR